MSLKFSVYIIYSAKQDIYYKGFTSDVEKRLFMHNENDSRYTANKGPWELVYRADFDTKKEAFVEEKRLKRLNRKSLEKIIRN